MALNASAIGSGEASQPVFNSTHKRRYFPVALIVTRWSNELKVSAFMMRIVRFSFPLPGELCANQAGFLGISSLNYMARCTPAGFPLGEDINIPTVRTSGALSPRRCEQINYLGWVRVIIFLFFLVGKGGNASCTIAPGRACGGPSGLAKLA